MQSGAFPERSIRETSDDSLGDRDWIVGVAQNPVDTVVDPFPHGLDGAYYGQTPAGHGLEQRVGCAVVNRWRHTDLRRPKKRRHGARRYRRQQADRMADAQSIHPMLRGRAALHRGTEKHGPGRLLQYERNRLKETVISYIGPKSSRIDHHRDVRIGRREGGAFPQRTEDIGPDAAVSGS